MELVVAVYRAVGLEGVQDGEARAVGADGKHRAVSLGPGGSRPVEGFSEQEKGAGGLGPVGHRERVQEGGTRAVDVDGADHPPVPDSAELRRPVEYAPRSDEAILRIDPGAYAEVVREVVEVYEPGAVGGHAEDGPSAAGAPGRRRPVEHIADDEHPGGGPGPLAVGGVGRVHLQEVIYLRRDLRRQPACQKQAKPGDQS